MKKLFKISARNIPSVYDSNTVYKKSEKCSICGGSRTYIDVLGAYLPTFKHNFGLINPLGGIIGSEEAIEYLKDQDINGLTIKNAIVTFGKRDIGDEQYFEIKPVEEIELNSEKGPGPVIDCYQCNRRRFDYKEGAHIVKNLPSVDLLLIKHTWSLLCTGRFMKVAKKVPGKCYLTFEEWEYELK